jgi:uncharacterized protein YeaO (DUF488 family)
MTTRTKRVYEEPSDADGIRVLVDRVWPRGLSKERARVDHWLKDVAPSAPLRKWFNHEPAKWEEFRHRYFAELDENPEPARALFRIARRKRVTLLFGAKDEDHNNAVALKDYLAGRAKH